MLESDLNKLKQFESILKKCLIARFGNNLPQDKVSLLNNTDYIEIEEIKGLTNRNEIQGTILRKMLDNIVNIVTEKIFTLDDSSTVSLKYGEDIQKGLIEYYANQISQKYEFDINQIPELNDNIDLIKTIKEKLENNLDKKVFTSNAIELLDIEILSSIKETYDKKLLDEYLEKNKIISEPIDIPNQTNESLFEEEFESSIELVEKDSNQYLKYINSEGEEHLIKITNDQTTIDFYKKRISDLAPGEKLNPEEFFGELKKLTSTSKDDSLNENKSVNILSLAKNNEPKKEVKEKIKDDSLDLATANILSLSNSKADISQNDIVKEEKISTKISDTSDLLDASSLEFLNDEDEKKIDTNTMLNSGTEKEDPNDFSLEEKLLFGDTIPTQNEKEKEPEKQTKSLTQEEYTDLCMKYANGIELSDEEYRALLEATPDFYTDEEKQNFQNPSSKGPILKKEETKSSYLGFGSKNMIIYMTFVTVVIGLIFGAILFKLTS